MDIVGSSPAIGETNCPVTIGCLDGKMVGNFGVFLQFCKIFEMVVKPQFVECQVCPKILLIPDFTMASVSHLVELLTRGETLLHSKEERKEIVKLQIALGCSVITQLKPEAAPGNGQCPYCSRYL